MDVFDEDHTTRLSVAFDGIIVACSRIPFPMKSEAPDGDTVIPLTGTTGAGVGIGVGVGVGVGSGVGSGAGSGVGVGDPPSVEISSSPFRKKLPSDPEAAEASIEDLICPAVADGFFEKRRCAAPATWGVAIDVPLMYANPPFGTVLGTISPGAAI